MTGSEQFVKEHWIRAEACPSPSDPRCCISLGGRNFTRATVPQTMSGYAVSESEAWHAAAGFTHDRLEEIRCLQEEICQIDDLMEYKLSDIGREIDAVQDSECSVFDLEALGTDVRDQCEYGRILGRLQAALADLRKGMK